MTDRVHALVVILEKDERIDDVAELQNAICLMRNVASVSCEITDVALLTATERVRSELSKKLWDVLRER